MNGQIILELNGTKVTVMGGPYTQKPRRVKGVKLAKEIDLPAEVYLDIEDFSVPGILELDVAITDTLRVLLEEGEVYLGCMGGIGRTGMFMACLVKAISAYNRLKATTTYRNKFKALFPRAYYKGRMDTYRFNRAKHYVRENYLPNACETEEQSILVEDYDPTNRVRLMFFP